MQPEYDVPHKRDSYTCASEQPVWLAGWVLLWKYKGQCQTFSSCAQAERPCPVVSPREN